MTSYVSHTSIDSTDAFALSQWWKGVLGYSDVEGDPNEEGDAECMIVSDDGAHRLLFIEVPEAKSGKNRVHMDLMPVEDTRDAELGRLLDIGATQIADLRDRHGPRTGWVVLADPEGNEFCLLRGSAESHPAEGGDT
ncbi:MAG: VOC family protein [Ornithinimicrobium sp.]